MISVTATKAFEQALGTLNEAMKKHNVLAQSNGRIIFFDTQDYDDVEEYFAEGYVFHPELFGNIEQRKQRKQRNKNKGDQNEGDCHKAIEQALSILSKAMKTHNISIYCDGNIDFFKVEDCNIEEGTFTNGYEFSPMALVSSY